MKWFDGLIFDLDGTLLDSMHVWSQVDTEFLARRGLDVPPDYAEALLSMGFHSSAEYTIKRFGLPQSPQEIISEWNELAIRAYSHKVTLKPFALEYLLAMHRAGAKLSIATALDEALYAPALKNNGIYDLFSSFTTLKEVSRGKGFPDIYLRAADKLGLSSDKCAVFEDILAGIRGANSGGFFTVGVFDKTSLQDNECIRKEAGCFIESFETLLR